MPRTLPTKFPVCFWNSRKRATARRSYPHIDDSGTPLSKAPHTHKPQPNQAKNTTHQVSDVLCIFQTTRPPSQSPKIPRGPPTKLPQYSRFAQAARRPTHAKSPAKHPMFCFATYKNKKRHRDKLSILILTSKAHCFQKSNPSTSRSSISQVHHPPSVRSVFVLLLHNTVSKPKPNDNRSLLTHQVMICFLRISEKHSDKHNVSS
jgi:hypothetical protein